MSLFGKQKEIITPVAPSEKPEMPVRKWNVEWARKAWWEEFASLIRYSVDDHDSLIVLHANRKRVIAAARDIADAMIAEWEDRWAE